ncbi:site-2 protease family protein [Leptospira idonii]|uniref:Site-2 protease family protein n=1 Tax=Leptospira idonii TaxID=1193500 RepID=A0A4R9M2K8_9LEPT|nr:site-2 protease family protein [Leptospira idonii]TGN20352.1 site-2 protease family protein [Leptospira idonii]
MKPNYPLHISLFILTFLSITFCDVFLDPRYPQTWEVYSAAFFSNWPYSVALIVILFFHEMGHYLPARYYGVRASLPYFIPVPFGPIGTMGAVIKIKDPIPDKKILFDIGVGGPLMSLILSVVIWIYGIHLSHVVAFPADLDKSQFLLFGDSAFTYLTSQWILGPVDFSVMDIEAHPLAKAGWVGLLITAINMLPFGQLDGGHVIYSLFGETYRKWIYWLFIAFLFLAFFSITWLLWGFIIYYLIKVEHPFVKDSSEGLSKFRRALGFFMLISLAVIFVPKPIVVATEALGNNVLSDVWEILLQRLGEL